MSAYRKPRVLNAPDRVFLQIGGDFEGEDVDYRDTHIEDITWHSERIFDADVEYRLVKRRSPRAKGRTE